MSQHGNLQDAKKALLPRHHSQATNIGNPLAGMQVSNQSKSKNLGGLLCAQLFLISLRFKRKL